MKRKTEKKKNEIMTGDKIGDTIDILNEIILYPQRHADADISKDSWVDILTKYTSGMALGLSDARVYESMAHTDNQHIVGDYFNQYTISVSSANNALTEVYTMNEIQILFIDKFYTLLGQLENEFEWMNSSLKDRIKTLAQNLPLRVVSKISAIDLNAIYYVAQLNFVQKNGNNDGFDPEDVEMAMAPIVNSLVADIMAGLTMSLYDAFYVELVTDITSKDFDIICEYMKPYLVDFRDDLLYTVAHILYSLIAHRVSTTYTIYNQAKELADSLDIPFYY